MYVAGLGFYHGRAEATAATDLTLDEHDVPSVTPALHGTRDRRR
jgi:hypothetical protein